MLAMLGAAFASDTPFAADVYRWTDERGNTHFGDKPPPAGAMRIEVHTGGERADGRHQERTQRLLDEFAAARAEKQAAAEERAKAAEARTAACSEARQRHYEYEHSGYLYVWDDNGEKRVLSAQEHLDARASARADVDRWCD
jgi:hypothetical protein